MSVNISKKNKAFEIFVKKYFKLRYFILGLIILIISSIFGNAVQAIILSIIFIPAVMYSFRISQYVPHINVELLSGCCLLLGYINGPLIAFVFGIIAGFYGIYKANFIRFLVVVRIFVIAVVAAGMTFFTNYSFNIYFIIGILVMNIILFFVYLVLDPDPIQNYTHRASHLFSNLILWRFLFLAIHNLLQFIN